jgi:hypothetical protein
MTIELAFSGANLIVLIGYFIRTENRLTKLETKIDIIFGKRQHGI